MRLKPPPTILVKATSTTADEHARDLCRLARRFEEAGDYEKAAVALEEFWAGVGIEPSVHGLGHAAAAEVLLRAGTITRRIGGGDCGGDVQEWAKDMIGRSLRIYERLNLAERVAEAKSELAYCYWRQGEYDNARALLREAIADLRDPELKAEAVLRGAVVEKCAGHAAEALATLNESARFYYENSVLGLSRLCQPLDRHFQPEPFQHPNQVPLDSFSMLPVEVVSSHLSVAGSLLEDGVGDH